MRADADGGKARLLQGKAVKRRLHLCTGNAGEAGGGAGGERVHNVMPPDQLPFHRVIGAIDVQDKAAAVGGKIVRRNVGVEVKGKGVLRAVAELVLPARGGGQVEIEDKRAVAVGVDFAFRGNHPFERAETGKVRRGYVGDERDVRTGKRRQPRNFAGVVRAHFNHGKAVSVAQAQQGERHADVVVQVADGGEGLSARLQQALQHFFGASFAVAAGNGEELCLATRAAVAGECLQGDQGVGDDDLRQIYVWLVFGDDGSDGALPFRSF